MLGFSEGGRVHQRSRPMPDSGHTTGGARHRAQPPQPEGQNGFDSLRGPDQRELFNGSCTRECLSPR